MANSTQNDRLSDLDVISLESIVSTLRERFFNHHVFTAVTDATLVSINPHTVLGNLNDDEILRQYTAQYRQTDQSKRVHMSPHVFGLACDAYYYMMRTGQDQSINLLGETSSGKTEICRLIVRTLISLSAAPAGKKGSKLASQIPAAQYALEMFGNCQTLDNANASRFSKYLEVQFDDIGRLQGVKTLSYYVEKDRIAKAYAGERNFHIFYALIAGTPAEEKAHLLLEDASQYRILASHSRQGKDASQIDAARMLRLKQAFKHIGMSKRQVASICQILSAILHLGNVEFYQERQDTQETCAVRNEDVMHVVAMFLGVTDDAMRGALTFKTKVIRNEVCTVLLDVEGAAHNRDDLIGFLYSVLFSWLNEFVNQKLCKDSFSTFVSVLDCPGPQEQSRQNSLDQFVVNFVNESLQRYLLSTIFEKHVQEYQSEDLSAHLVSVAYADNSDCLRLIVNQPGGLVHIMDDQARRMPKKDEKTMMDAFVKRWGNHAAFKPGPMDRSGSPTFIINHFNGPVSYTTDHLLDKNVNIINADFVTLLRGSPNGRGGSEGSSTNPFVRDLLSTRAVNTQAHPRDENSIIALQQSIKPSRAPSTRRPVRAGSLRRPGAVSKKDSTEEVRKSVEEMQETDEDGDMEPTKTSSESMRCVSGEIRHAMQALNDTLENTKAWFVICVRPNDHQLPNQFEARQVKAQAANHAVTEIALTRRNEYTVSMTHAEFCERYADLAYLSAVAMKGVEGGEARQKCLAAKEVMDWTDGMVLIGRYKVFLCHQVFRQLDDELRAADPEEVQYNERRALVDADASARGERDSYSPFTLLDVFEKSELDPFAERVRKYASDDAFDDNKSMLTDLSASPSRSPYESSSRSISASEAYAPSHNMFSNFGYGEKEKGFPGFSGADEVTEVHRTSAQRLQWLTLVWMLTFWLPSPVLQYVFRMKRPDIRMAWREKLAINIMIWLTCLSAIFVITILGNLICPKQHVFSDAEFQAKANKYSMTRIRGEVFNLDNIVTMHRTAVPVVASDIILKYAGVDATPIFPVQVNALCNGIDGAISPWVQVSNDNTSDVYAQYHDFRAIHPEDTRPDWYYESMVLMRSNCRVGFMGYTPGGISDMVQEGKAVGLYNGEVYDVSDYIAQGYRGAVQAPRGQRAASDTDAAFMIQQLVSLFNQNPGQDLTKKINNLPISQDELLRQQVCLRNLFFIGKKDDRNAPQCLFARYILLALSVMMVAVIGFKFLAALQFGRQRRPEDHEKFVICQVPCYTEGEESMRKTLNSLAALKYDDKRKLLFIICDGMIVGAGNDRPTPRIVLDLLGADTTLEPEPLSFVSVGEGSKQHNMAKVYSGLYEYHGHVVPYVVVVKCGRPLERHRPGNRGKRDSQLILMRFLNKVHFSSPMNPMELEIYHQIKNIIGVNPSFYDYVFQVDADTEVDPLSLNRFVSAFTKDKKIVGLCGETSISNSKRTFITMLQVYEYFISHYLSKAFESLFGSVTCLPGCFSIFRIRSPDSHRPLFVANEIVDAYAENRVDTLHTKNLLHLGEDRYLTTLILKHFGNHKTMFIHDAKAQTAVPEDWKVLLSQRRRWINSTVHNLFELLGTAGLCGFCLFSMRFVVFIDLVSTIVSPVTLIYIVYLIILIAGDDGTIPMTAIIMLAAIYGLQAVLFLLRRRFDMIVWMLIYIIGLPIWTFFLPLYSFWHMDDFSWGNTRVVMGEKGKKIVKHDEGTFHPSEIPLRTWQQHEDEQWERESLRSIGSMLTSARAHKRGAPLGEGNQGAPRRSDMAASMYTANLYGFPASAMTPGAQQTSHPPSPDPSGFPSPKIESGGNGAYTTVPVRSPKYGEFHNVSVPGEAASGQIGNWPETTSSDLSPRPSHARVFGGQQQPQQTMSEAVAAYTSMANVHASTAQARTSVMHRPRFSAHSISQFAVPIANSSNVVGQTEAQSSRFNVASSDQAAEDAYGLRGRGSALIDDIDLGATAAHRTISTPTDEELSEEIRAVVASGNMHTITLQSIRRHLESKYGVEVIKAKRGFINDTLDEILTVF